MLRGDYSPSLEARRTAHEVVNWMVALFSENGTLSCSFKSSSWSVFLDFSCYNGTDTFQDGETNHVHTIFARFIK